MNRTTGIGLLVTGALVILTGVYMEKQFSLKTISEPTKTDSETTTTAKQPLLATATDALLNIHSGNHKSCNNLSLSEANLLELPQETFRTHHSWSKTADEFRGPALATILKLACPKVAKIQLRALNDYAVEMNYQDLSGYDPIISHSLNGKRLSIRDKGPLWVMIPLDKYDVPKRSMDDYLIWQLSDITIISTDETS